MTARYEQFPLGDRTSSVDGENTRWLFISLVFSIAVVIGIAVGVLGGTFVAILSVILAAALVTLADYRVGIWFLIILLPFSHTALIPREMFGIQGLNPLNAVIVATIGALVLARTLGAGPLELPRLSYLWWLYVLPISLAAFHGTFFVHEIPSVIFQGEGSLYLKPTVKSYLLGTFVKPAFIVVAAILTAIAVRNAAERFRWLMVPVFVAASLLALVIPVYVLVTDVSAVFSSVGKSEHFSKSVGIHANQMGLLLNTAFALSLFTWIGARQGVVKTLLFVVMAMVSVSVALTFSRGAYLGWLMVVAYLVLSRRRLGWLLATVAVMTVVVAIMPTEIVERAFYGIQERDVARISSGRVYDIWLPLLPSVLESPLFGHGLGSVVWSEPVRKGQMVPIGHTHNAYLGVVLDLGIVGAVLIWMFWFRLWQQFRALARELDDPAWRGYFEGASVCILVMLVQCVTDDSFTPTAAQSFIWVSAGVAFGLLGRSSTRMAGRPAGK